MDGSGLNDDAGLPVSKHAIELVTLVSVWSSFAAGVISLCGVFQHLRHYNEPRLQRYIVRIVLIVPVYAVGSTLSLKMPEDALYFEIIRDLYEAWVIYCFLVLILEYAGGDSACIASISRDPPMAHPWPFCKLPLIRKDGMFLRRCKQGTLQFVIVKPVMATFSLVFLSFDLYHTVWYQAILLIVYNVSYTWALYALLLFYMGAKKLLRPFSPVAKFLAVKSVVFMTYWQGLAVALIPGLSPEAAQLSNDAILSVEMVLFAILHLCAFSHVEFRKQKGAHVVSVLRNMKDVASVKDVAQDVYHNTVPKYSDYILHPYQESPDRKADKEARQSRAGSGIFSSGKKKKKKQQELSLIDHDSAAMDEELLLDDIGPSDVDPDNPPPDNRRLSAPFVDELLEEEGDDGLSSV